MNVLRLQGMKTYLVAAAWLAWELWGAYQMGRPPDFDRVFQALGLAALRAGVSKAAT